MKICNLEEYSASRRVSDLIDYIQETFPVAFPKKPNPKVALKVGIHEDLTAWGATIGIPKNMISQALRAWCQGIRYAEALSFPGAPRYGLSGVVTGNVREKDAAYAQVLSKEIIRLRDKARLNKAIKAVLENEVAAA